jgi:hypothetical protein
VKLIPISDMEVWRELGIVYRRDRTLPRSASAFVALARQGVGDAAEGEGKTSHKR